MSVEHSSIRAWAPNAQALIESATRGEARTLLVKENISTSGLPFECGSLTRHGVLGHEDATCVKILRQAAFEPIAVTRCDEFAYGCTGEANLMAQCLNPKDPSRLSGGSSGGSAAAVAAGLARFALGTDTAGSVRIPAALCGVYGFKPAYGSISTEGVYPLSPSLDHVGIIAREWPDLLELWAAFDSSSETGALRKEIRIGFAAADQAEPADPSVAAVWAAAKNAIGPAPEIRLEGWTECHRAGNIIQAFEAHAVHRENLARHAALYHPAVRYRLRAAAKITAADYRTASASMQLCRATASDSLGEADAVVLPTCAVTAPRRGTQTVTLPGGTATVRDALMRNTRMANYSGLPALTLPIRTAGLPVGLQIIGRTNHDVLLTAAILEELGLTGGDGRRPRAATAPPTAPEPASPPPAS